MNTALSTTNGKPGTALAELSASESLRLENLEGWFEDSVSSFVRSAVWLKEIRDDKLYRATHKTFEAYCKERWGFTRMRAHQLIAASGVIENVNHGLPNPNERQTRELAKAPKEQQQKIWEQVVEEHGEKITAAKVKDAVDGLVDDPEEGPEEDREEESEVEEAYYDELEQKLPAGLEQVFFDAELIDEIIGLTKALNKKAKELHESSAGNDFHIKVWRRHIREARKVLEESRPYAICPYCEGRKCMVCSRSGVVNKAAHKGSQEE